MDGATDIRSAERDSQSLYGRAASWFRRFYDPVEGGVLFFLLLFLWAYFFLSLATNRIFLFDDDIQRVELAAVGLGKLFSMYPWGGKCWLPAPTFIQSIFVGLLPFGAVSAVLIGNLVFTSVVLIWIHRLSRRIAPGPVSLIAPVLFALSPVTAWLATSALSEPLSALLFLGESLFLVRALERDSAGEFAFALGFAALAMLSRYEAWFVCPLPLFAVAGWNWYRRGRRGMGELAMAGATLLAPLSWMTASFVRYGTAFAEFQELTAMHLYRNANETFWSASRSMVEAARAVTLPGWVFLATGLIWIIVWLRKDRRTRGLPSLWIPLSLSLPLSAVFVASMYTRRYGVYLPRFVWAWYSLGLVVSVMPFRGIRTNPAWWIVLATIAVSGYAFWRVDASRPPSFETLGCRALQRVETLAKRHDGQETVAILLPKGGADIAVNTVYLYAPSEKNEVVPTEPGRFEEAVESCKANYLVFQRKYWPGMNPGARRKVVYEDGTYIVLGWNGGSQEAEERAP